MPQALKPHAGGSCANTSISQTLTEASRSPPLVSLCRMVPQLPQLAPIFHHRDSLRSNTGCCLEKGFGRVSQCSRFSHSCASLMRLKSLEQKQCEMLSGPGNTWASQNLECHQLCCANSLPSLLLNQVDSLPVTPSSPSQAWALHFAPQYQRKGPEVQQYSLWVFTCLVSFAYSSNALFVSIVSRVRDHTHIIFLQEL